MRTTSFRFYEKFGIPNIFGAVDGCQIRFQKCPRKIPVGQWADLYFCRKGFYSLNVQIVSNDKVIYSVDAGWFGSAHDARVWRRSQAKADLENPEEPHEFLLAADMAYPISLKVLKHYESPSTRQEHHFNKILNGLRTLSSECVYARLKQRFPILREMRCNVKNSQRIVLACCILHNMAEHSFDEVPFEIDENDPFGRPLPRTEVDIPQTVRQPENCAIIEARAQRDRYKEIVWNNRHNRQC